MSASDWTRLVGEVEAFSNLDRRRLFHLAYERGFYVRALDAIALHSAGPSPTPDRPRIQAVFCIDEREESIRRYIEELAPTAETFGIAGFFSVPMYYKGTADAHYTPLCPAVVVPSHWVTEDVIEDAADDHRWQTQVRRAVGSTSAAGRSWPGRCSPGPAWWPGSRSSRGPCSRDSPPSCGSGPARSSARGPRGCTWNAPTRHQGRTASRSALARTR